MDLWFPTKLKSSSKSIAKFLPPFNQRKHVSMLLLISHLSLRLSFLVSWKLANFSLVCTTVASHFFEKENYLERKLNFVPLSKHHLDLSFSPPFFFKFFKHKKKNSSEHQTSHMIFTNLVWITAFGSTQSWRVDWLQRPESLWYLSVQ